MKKTTFIALFTAAILLIGFHSSSWGQAILYEDFNYTVPGNIGGNTTASGTTNNNWTTHSNTKVGTDDVVASSLTYTGLSNPTGNKVFIPGNNTTTPRDVNRGFTSTATVLYYSALIQVVDNTQLGTADDYFMNFGATSGATVTSFGGKLGIKSVNAGANFRLSINNTSGGTVTFTEFATDLSFGTTYLVVVKYDRSVSPTVASLWVNPVSLGGTEPAGSVSNSSGTGTFAAFASICLRNSSGTPKANIDEIRIGTTWADVTPGVAVVAPTVTTQTPTTIGTTSATGNGNITATGGENPGTRGFCWDLSTNADPTTASAHTTETGSFAAGAFTGSITGLTVNTSYKVRAYAINSAGTSYGDPLTFTTSASPSITVSTNTLTGFTYTGAGPSAEQTFTVSGTNLTAPLVVAPATDYEVSLSTGTGFTTPISLTPSSGTVSTTTIYVRLKGGLAIGTYSTLENIVASSTTASQTIACSGSVTAPAPAITLGATSLTFGSQTVNTTSAEQTYTVSGINLTADVTVTPPSGYKISTTTGTGYVTTPIVLTQTGGTLATTNIYVVFAPTLAQSYPGNITHVSGAVTQNVAVTGTGVNAITNPVPQAIPYSQDFSALVWASTTYPAGWQGWQIGSPSAAYSTAAPTADRVLAPSVTANSTSGNVNNYNGAVGFLNTSSLDLSLVLAIDATGASNVNLAYDISTIRNPYDGTTNTRINEVSPQYRIGTSGAFTTITGFEYQNNTTLQTGSVTTPQNVVTKTLVLPSACDNQSIVQIRWASKQVSGAGGRPSFAVDNISVTNGGSATVAAPIFAPPGGNYVTNQSVTISCSTPSSEIRYTTDGTDPTATSTLFNISTPILVNATTTLKAKAFAAGMTASATVTAVYTFPVQVTSIAALRAGLTNGTVYKLTSQAIVTYHRPSNLANQIWLQDATGAIVTYDVGGNITTDYQIGDGVTGLTGTIQSYNQLLELIPSVGADPGPASSTGNTITPIARSLSTLTSADQSKLVSIPNVSFTNPTGNFAYAQVAGTQAGIAYPITDNNGSGTGTFQTLLSEADYIGSPIPTIPQKIVGLVDQYGANITITPRVAADMTPFAPSWTSGWPKAENASQTVFTAKVNIDVPGTAYFVVLPSGAPAPTALQVKNGQNAAGVALASNLFGTIPCAAGSTEYVAPVTGLTAATTYNVYFVAEAYTTLQAAPVMVPVTTTLGGTPPVVLSPTATSITDVSAILGGDISSNGGQPVLERGTVWSTATPVLATDHKLAEGGTAIGVFSHLRTTLPTATHIYYAAYAKNALGTTLSSEGSFYTLSSEPTNHVTGLTASSNTTTTVLVSWTDATTGAVLPEKYLIKGSNVSYAAITDPVDGTPEADGGLVYNVAQGVGNHTFTGLILGTPYYFKIYPYTGSAATINYKTTATVPQATATTLSAVTYTWSGADNGLWTDATNWTPNRTAPDIQDRLVFNDNTTKTVTGVTTQSIGQLHVVGTTTAVTLVAAATGTVVTISGLVGSADLIVNPGCALNLYGTNTLSLTLGASATGSIDGNMTFSSTASTAHRLISGAAGAITFNNGSVFTAGAFFNGNAFGTLPLNSVIFMPGSTYVHFSGSSPFGASQPNSVVVFQHGSLCKVTGPVTPSYSGRTYSNLEYDYPTGIFTQTGASAVVMDNLTVTNGTLNFGVTAIPGHTIKGNITVGAGGILNFNPGSASTITLGGTGNQTISGTGAISGNANLNLVVANGSGVTFDNNMTLDGMITLNSNNNIVLGTGNLTLGTAATISGTFSASSMVIASGTGQLRKTFSATSATSYTFPVGDNTGTPEYSPVSLNFSTPSSTSGYVGVNLVNSAYPSVTGDHIARYWNLSTSGLTGYTCSAQFNYVLADVSGTESNIYCYRVDPTVNLFSAANTTSHFLTATGLTGFGTFTGKEQPPTTKTLNLKIFLESLFNGTNMNQAMDMTPTPKFTAPVADQVTVELHNTFAPYDMVLTFSNVNVNIDGTAPITTVPGALTGSYYIVVKHRNSIETWDATPVSFSGSGPFSYDFTTSADKAFGNNLKSMGSIFALFAGDVTQDGVVDGSDMANVDNSSTAILLGYTTDDVNGDGVVDGSDMAIVDNNATAIVQAVRPQ
ncbi:MAG: chitobiase/beta-hexosaminidase C-terminal domain-containing protein [Bacteroidetes bacterium]|nr:chitobiase/beta-hexosaminidase C-terminal domain-containing protein [Bacteroidota bacterium]